MLEEAGQLPDTYPDGNHQHGLNDHECIVTAVAVSSCGSMMASADTSGKIVLRFACTQ